MKLFFSYAFRTWWCDIFSSKIVLDFEEKVECQCVKRDKVLNSVVDVNLHLEDVCCMPTDTGVRARSDNARAGAAGHHAH